MMLKNLTPIAFLASLHQVGDEMGLGKTGMYTMYDDVFAHAGLITCSSCTPLV